MLLEVALRRWQNRWLSSVVENSRGLVDRTLELPLTDCGIVRPGHEVIPRLAARVTSAETSIKQLLDEVLASKHPSTQVNKQLNKRATDASVILEYGKEYAISAGATRRVEFAQAADALISAVIVLCNLEESPPTPASVPLFGGPEMSVREYPPQSISPPRVDILRQLEAQEASLSHLKPPSWICHVCFIGSDELVILTS